jgi:hypothetical protein
MGSACSGPSSLYKRDVRRRSQSDIHVTLRFKKSKRVGHSNGDLTPAENDDVTAERAGIDTKERKMCTFRHYSPRLPTIIISPVLDKEKLRGESSVEKIKEDKISSSFHPVISKDRRKEYGRRRPSRSRACSQCAIIEPILNILNAK